PLLLGPGAGSKQSRARAGGFAAVVEAGGAGGLRMAVVMVAPQALAGQEAVLDGVASNFLEIRVGEVEALGSYCVLVSEIDARDSFVVCRECNGHTVLSVERQRMV